MPMGNLLNQLRTQAGQGTGPPALLLLTLLLIPAAIVAYRLAHQDFETAIEMSGIALSLFHASKDREEGARSFREKRQPRFGD